VSDEIRGAASFPSASVAVMTTIDRRRASLRALIGRLSRVRLRL